MTQSEQVEAGLTEASFVADVHRALAALYNPDALRESPLLAMLVAHRRVNPVGALRQVLTEGVAALKPEASVPPHAWAWRAYQILTYRFIEQAAQKQVAADLGLSVRQLRRAEERAVHVLADYLWNRYDVAAQAAAVPRTDGQAGAAAAAHPAAAEGLAAGLPASNPPSDELMHLSLLPAGEACDLGQLIPAVLKTAQPLLIARDVEVEEDLPAALPRVSASPAVVRQMLLNLVMLAATAVPGGQVTIAAAAEGDRVIVHVAATAEGGRAVAAGADAAETLAVTQDLAKLVAGAVAIDHSNPALLRSLLALPAVPEARLLAIDDNVDTLRLIERCLQDSPYSVTGVSDPHAAVRVAESLAPRFILLDIMLPEIDGWELLGRLREHPRLGNVPVIVCTFLPQEQLAATVGAAAFLRKPITRESLLAVLDRLAQGSAPESA
jgi:CheY-like chemotaxis protein